MGESSHRDTCPLRQPPPLRYLGWDGPAPAYCPKPPPALYNLPPSHREKEWLNRVFTFLSAPWSREAGRGLLNSPDQETESTRFGGTNSPPLRVKSPIKKLICSPKHSLFPAAEPLRGSRLCGNDGRGRGNDGRGRGNDGRGRGMTGEGRGMTGEGRGMTGGVEGLTLTCLLSRLPPPWLQGVR